IFCSLTTGGSLHIYDQREELSSILWHSFSPVSGINSIKLTPAHVRLLKDMVLQGTSMHCAIVGGEELTAGQGRILKQINPAVHVYNEYGQTEATVGCVVKEVEADSEVVIGKPIAGAQIYILDEGN